MMLRALMLLMLFATSACAEKWQARLDELGEGSDAKLTTLAETAGKRPVQLLTLGGDGADSRPAVLIVGAVDIAKPWSADLAVGLAEELAKQEALLKEITFYIVPDPSPDASAKSQAKPLALDSGNLRPSDDDRDGRIDEDPPEDLNHDGVITAMRVADPAGDYRPHPDDPRELVKVDRAKGERAEFRLLTEGIDNDHDDRWNEDGPGGVDFNRNFTWKYPYFKPGAGPNQVSELETRTVADFAFNHRNIFLVLSIGPEANLLEPWKASGKGSGGGLSKADAEVYAWLAKSYEDELKFKDAPKSGAGEGAFATWAHHHLGRWSLSTPAWWPVAPKKSAAEKTPPTDVGGSNDKTPVSRDARVTNNEQGSAAPAKDADAKKKKDEDIALRTLHWLDANNPSAFIPWTKIEHPDFPGKTVEIGGIKPYAIAPTAKVLDELAGKHAKWLTAVLADRAKLAIEEVKVEAAGEQVFRITAKVINTGRLPTSSKQGAMAKQLQRLEIELVAPKGTVFLSGSPRQPCGVLRGLGGSVEKQWLVRVTGAEEQMQVKVGEPSVGFVEREVVLLAPAEKP